MCLWIMVICIVFGWWIDGCKVFCMMVLVVIVILIVVIFIDEDGCECYGYV